ncbi:type II toxin-antitoxin system RelE/ParE family toxin [Roseitalea porphyridii]|uniref:Plasmid maintenance system killer protein n=1 Tax=Roseitalea porphyridii TaxID=1852022 RepID=A0A4P6V3X0_9HYPH|nr:type II toxin-antitoxin system RelE/ParE family toxin [Roseitalea porphyridii]QBK31449.1 hypothetical protein E0E05_13040 [Roseitalea porphyridii]
MIRSIRHKALRAYWIEGRTRGLNAEWLTRSAVILDALDSAVSPEDMDIPGLRFHRLKREMADRFSVRLTGNWRVTFAWSEQDAIDIDIEDYH